MYELQFHPADIRKPVRYFFLSRSAARWIFLVGALCVVVLVAGLALAPLGIKSLLMTSSLRRAEHRKMIQMDVLQQRNDSLKSLESRLKAAKVREEQIALVLGVEQVEHGLGGMPEKQPPELKMAETREALLRSITLEGKSRVLLSLLDDVGGFAADHKDLVRAVPAICPLPIGSFVLTSPFGERISPFTNARDFHTGLDLAARVGTAVLATGDARVVFAGRFPLRRNVRWWRYGNVVVLRHDEGYLTIYAHLESVAVRRGQKIKRGETIGKVGNTGWSTSPHLHYEVRVIPQPGEEPVPVDPRIYILNYEWKDHEAALIRARKAPRPDFDPLPSHFLH